MLQFVEQHPLMFFCLLVPCYIDDRSYRTSHGLIVRERGGKWGRGLTAAVPPNTQLTQPTGMVTSFRPALVWKQWSEN